LNIVKGGANHFPHLIFRSFMDSLAGVAMEPTKGMKARVPMVQMDSAHPWYENRWWREEQLRGPLPCGYSVEMVDGAMERAAKVFDSEWCALQRPHPAYAQMALMQGFLSFRLFFPIGRDLLSLEGCTRLPSLERELRDESSFYSTMLELEIAAALRRMGHSVELKPPLAQKKKGQPGKTSDIGVLEHDSTTHYEVKIFTGSKLRNRIGDIQSRIAEAMFRLVVTRSWVGPAPGYCVEISSSILESKGLTALMDDTGCAALTSEFEAVVAEKMKSPILPSEFVAANHIHVRIAIDEQSSISGPPVPPDVELRRVWLQHFKTVPNQLPVGSPGVLIIQPSATVNPREVGEIVEDRMRNWGFAGAHVLAAMFLPIRGDYLVPWALFHPFFVQNPQATMDPMSLPSFRTLTEIYGAEKHPM
jgi:hypothetical protein